MKPAHSRTRREDDAADADWPVPPRPHVAPVMPRPEPAAAPIPELLSTSDVCAKFGRGERTIRRWVHFGRLPVVRIGRSLFFRPEDVQRLITDGLVDKILSRTPVSVSLDGR